MTSKLNIENKTKSVGIYFNGVGISIVISDLIARLGLYYYSWEVSWVILSILGIIITSYPIYILSFDGQINIKNN